MQGIGHVESEKEIEIHEMKEKALEKMKEEEKHLLETIEQLENEYVEMVNWIPSRQDFIDQNIGEQRNAAQERELFNPKFHCLPDCFRFFLTGIFHISLIK